MADQTKLKKRIDALLKLPENQVCADCRKRGPRWASANLGVFICIECSGIHRNLGVHISFVRSVNLDSWTAKQVEFMEEWGNARANEYFEANLSSKVQRPKEGDTVRTVEKFIRDKYEYKRYIGGAIPPKRTAEPEDHSSHRSQKPVDSHHASHHATAAPAPTPAIDAAIAPVVKAAPATDSLIDFLDDPIPAPVSFAPPAEPNNHSHIEFGDFSVASAAPAQQPPQTDFLSYSSATFEATPAAAPPAHQMAFFPTGGAPPPAAHAPQRPQASADAILSLYNTGGSASRISGMGISGPQQMHAHQGYGQPQFPPHGFAPSQPGYPMHPGGGYPQQQQQQQAMPMPMPMHAPYGGGMPAPVNPFAPSNGGGQMMMQPPPAVPGQYPAHYGMQQPQHMQQHQQMQQMPPPVPMQQQAMYGGMPSYNPPPVPGQAPMNPFQPQQGLNRQAAAPQWPGRS